MTRCMGGGRAGCGVGIYSEAEGGVHVAADAGGGQGTTCARCRMRDAGTRKSVRTPESQDCLGAAKAFHSYCIRPRHKKEKRGGIEAGIEVHRVYSLLMEKEYDNDIEDIASSVAGSGREGMGGATRRSGSCDKDGTSESILGMNGGGTTYPWLGILRLFKGFESSTDTRQPVDLTRRIRNRVEAGCGRIYIEIGHRRQLLLCKARIRVGESGGKAYPMFGYDLRDARASDRRIADVVSAVQQLDPLVVRTIAAKIAAGPIVIDSDGRN
ncbi:hypothetical protein B0H11DRAFT_2355743 [Mycena galericulata]|nr:hypothetical protein B0H11DRAFT_2355743 [Mycena galericulata]